MIRKMTEPDWQQVKALFAEAVEQPVDTRIAFLERRCRGNTRLFDEVSSLLAASAEPQNLIENNVIDIASKIDDNNGDYAQQRFGNYRIIREIGSGGMGAVFLAERDDGEFEQTVALKIVRQSIADSEMLARFRRERQILATLNHPNIAALHDGGVSQKGEPYLAMEYVDGTTLTEYCDQNRLSISDKLGLFLKICSAVSYAHRNLVVHRDIKPSNILITSSGEPKLLDFGLAKAFESDASTTQTALRAFTPAYASPEQIQGGNITTASDVYSLGVVFYELLAGKKPLDVEGKSYEEVLETINHTEPAKPSSVSIDSGDSRQHLHGDLDNIALVAIRKEPDRRFGSVEDFAKDIELHLAARPISARPNTFSYRASKFVKRNRLAVAAAVVVIISVLTGLAISLRQGAIARRESAKSEAVNQYLQKMLLTAIPGSGGGGKKGVQASVVDILNQAAARLDGDDLVSQPDVRAELRQVIGECYVTQGMYGEGERLLLTAVDEQKALYGSGSRQTLKTEFDLATLYLTKAEYYKSLEIDERRISELRDEFQHQRIEPVFFAGKLMDYALVCRALGNAAESELLLREAVEIFTRWAPDSVDSARSLLTLILLDQGKFDEAKSAQQEAVSRLRNLPENDASGLPSAMTLLGSILMEKGELKEAEANLVEAENLYRKLYGSDNTSIYDNIRLQAQVAYLAGDYVSAERKINVTLENYRKTSGPKYISFATALTIQGLILNKRGNASDAESVLREALRLRRENLPKGHFMTALTEGALGEVLLEEKKLTEADPLLRESYASLTASQKQENGRIKSARMRLERVEAGLGSNPSN